MSYVTHIVEIFGGVRPMARAIGRATSTVQSWKDRQSIPDEHKPHVLQVALAHGYCVTPSDFFPSLQTSEDAA
ncbi:carph-isopro domain-containing protein [Paracoccus sp. JM45]|uniref:carph-isopro domain-containing protein n=1 Tax=Paracoccus sp. JM45 TaxID=2283626 RepID=UPI0011C3D264|nr:hypothetical protein [Paracoccus sp. JM45]